MIATLLRRAQDLAHALTEKAAPLAPLLARVTVGTIFVSTGWGKLHNLDKVIEFFTELGIPAPALQAPFVAAVEFVGGALVLAGIGSRIASLMLSGTMVVAILTAKRADIAGVTDLFGVVEWTYLVLLVWIAIAGPGALSLERLLPGKRPE
jgi:putative oxidoreductase